MKPNRLHMAMLAAMIGSAAPMARQVASWTDGHFNPVFLHGPYGYGKTHLLNAIAWEAQRLRPDAKVVYLTAERFLSTFVRAAQDRTMAAFKDSLRNADMLLIDDVQFVGGKAGTQEELLSTLTALIEDGKKIVISADRPPMALTEVEPRLRSHLASGLTCPVEPADRALACDLAALVEQHQRGDGADAVALAERGLDLGVHLGQAHLRLEHRGGAFEVRRHHLAGAAPRRPEIHQHRRGHGGLDDLGFKVLDGDVDHGLWACKRWECGPCGAEP